MIRLVRRAGSRLASFLSSIRFRLTLWFVMILAIVLGVFSAFIYISQSRDLRLDAVQSMQSKLGRLDAYFRSQAWQDSNLSPADVPGSNGSVPLQTGDFILLTTTDGQVVQNWGVKPADPSKLAGDLISASSQSRDLSVYQQTISVSDEKNLQSSGSYLFIVLPVLRHDMPIGYLVLGSPSALNDQLRRLMISLILGSLGMLAIAFVGGLWLADRAMSPVKSIARTARDISESDLSRRLNMQGRDELAHLAGTFDGMLARLQKAFERQRQFVADASHELRTPLTIINLEVGRVLTGVRKADEYHHALEVVDSESTRMTRLVNDLLTLARMDSGQTILQLEDVDLSEVAVEAQERLARLAALQQISIEMGALPELVVHGDRQYLTQMISNLVENAIKYGPPGSKVQIETEACQKCQTKMAVVRVSDNGPGIPSEDLPHLFDRFYRADPARSQDTGDGGAYPSGTGLGLSIVAWIVKAHGGSIRVDSIVNQGSSFEVSLPLAQA